MNWLSGKRIVLLLSVVVVLGISIGVGIGIVGTLEDSTDSAESAQAGTENQSDSASSTNQSNATDASNDASNKSTQPKPANGNEEQPEEIPGSYVAKVISDIRSRVKTDMWDRFSASSAESILWARRHPCGTLCNATGEQLTDISNRWAQLETAKLPASATQTLTADGWHLYFDDSFTYIGKWESAERTGHAFGSISVTWERESWTHAINYLVWDAEPRPLEPIVLIGDSNPTPSIKITEPSLSSMPNRPRSSVDSGSKIQLKWKADNLNPKGRLEVWVYSPDETWQKIHTTDPEPGSLEWSIPDDWQGSAIFAVGNFTNPEGDTNDEQFEAWEEVRVQIF